MDDDCIYISDDEPEVIKEFLNLVPPLIDLTDEEQHSFTQEQTEQQQTTTTSSQQQQSPEPESPPRYTQKPPPVYRQQSQGSPTWLNKQSNYYYQQQQQHNHNQNQDYQQPHNNNNNNHHFNTFRRPFFQPTFINRPQQIFIPRHKSAFTSQKPQSEDPPPPPQAQRDSTPTPKDPSPSPAKNPTPPLPRDPTSTSKDPSPSPPKDATPPLPRDPTPPPTVTRQEDQQHQDQQQQQQQKPPIDERELMMTQKALGNEQYKRNQFDEAIRIYKRSNELAKKIGDMEMSAILHFNLAMTYCKLRSYDQAIDECANAVKLNDRYFKAHLKRAEIYQRQYKFEEAIICYEHICELDTTNQDYLILLNKAKEAAKFTRKKDFYSILGLKPNFSLQDLKKAYRQQALKHHPDRHSDADIVTRRIQEKHFKDASEAYTFIQKRVCN